MGHHFELGLIGVVVGMLYLVWALNLYNFMDGIDGLAGVEAMMVGVVATLVYWVSGVFILNVSLEFFLPLFLAAGSFGFLIWNFPIAKIFMGDVGSGFLGLMIGALSLHAAVQQPSFLWSWLVLLGVFIVDATLTLLRRFIRGECVYDAHRSHAYQHAANTLMGHQLVTYVVMVINFLWLFPIAIAITVGWVSGLEGLVLAYVPLILLALRFKAGMP
jgi:Fuc2NAc and GlcNAc transferase